MKTKIALMIGLTMASTTLTMGSDTITVSGTSTINQDVSTTASPTFVGATFSGGVSGITTLTVGGASAGPKVTVTANYDHIKLISTDNAQVYSGSNIEFDAYANGGGSYVWVMQEGSYGNTRVGSNAFGIYDVSQGNLLRFQITQNGSVYFPVAGASSGFTSTGLNSCAIGATTASTGAFTTLNVATSTPASSSATGIAGTITWDSNYIYVCTATNTWKRVAIAAW